MSFRRRVLVYLLIFGASILIVAQLPYADIETIISALSLLLQVDFIVALLPIGGLLFVFLLWKNP